MKYEEIEKFCFLKKEFLLKKDENKFKLIEFFLFI